MAEILHAPLHAPRTNGEDLHGSLGILASWQIWKNLGALGVLGSLGIESLGLISYLLESSLVNGINVINVTCCKCVLAHLLVAPLTLLWSSEMESKVIITVQHTQQLPAVIETVKEKTGREI